MARSSAAAPTPAAQSWSMSCRVMFQDFLTELPVTWMGQNRRLPVMLKDKAGAEKLQGFWILELGELAGMKKADVETVKSQGGSASR